MNQKMLYIAIVAVAAVVIVIGVWVTGAGQSGPLAGDIAYKTTLTLTATDDAVCEDGIKYRQILFAGILKADGAPIPVRAVTIYTMEGPTAITTLNTDVNGTFSKLVGVQAFGPANYYATFTGNTQYESCQSNVVSVPAATYC